MTGATLLRKLRNAVPWRTTTVTDFYDFTESLPAEQVIKWTLAVEKWEDDPTQENPFVPTTKSMSGIFTMIHITLTESLAAITQHGVRLALAEQDAENLRREGSVPIHDDIPPSALITTGLEYEAQQ